MVSSPARILENVEFTESFCESSYSETLSEAELLYTIVCRKDISFGGLCTLVCGKAASNTFCTCNPYDRKRADYSAEISKASLRGTKELVVMWYVIQTKSGQEEPMRERVEKMLPLHSYEDCKILYYVKKKKYLGEWHEERERLLPGYMFLVTDDPEPVSETLDRMTEFTRILGTGSSFCPIRPEEEELLNKLTNGKDEIGMSYGVIEKGILKVRSIDWNGIND